LTQIGAPFEYQDRMDEVLALGLHKDNTGAVDAEEAMPLAA